MFAGGPAGAQRWRGGGDSPNAHRSIYVKRQWNGQAHAAGWVNCPRTAFRLKSALQWPDRGEPGTEIHSFIQYLLRARCGRATKLCARNTVGSRKTDMPLPLVNGASSSFHSFIGQSNSEVSLPVPSSPNVYNWASTVFQKLCEGPVCGFYQLASPLQASPSFLPCLIQTPRLRLLSEFTTSRGCYLSKM